MQKPELLIPAGNLEKLHTAILYGADAVYAGVEGLSLRGPSAEFTPADLAQGVSMAHRHGVRLYAACNTFARDADLKVAERLIPDIAEAGADALIVSDPGLIRMARKLAPGLPLHLSTQANTTNHEALRFWQDQGISRVILARELSLRAAGEMAAYAPTALETEIFIHGAMCMAYSGRCLLSAFRNRRSANQGDCSQPCRWEYALAESTRPDDPFVLEEDERFSYLLSSKDLCLIGHLPDVLKTGAAALKVEGRMKSSYYVAIVTRSYRQALNAALTNPSTYRVTPDWMVDLESVSHRGYTTGFAFRDDIISEVNPDIKIIQTHEPAGRVLECDMDRGLMQVDVRASLQCGDPVDLLLPEQTIPVDTTLLFNELETRIDRAHPGDRVLLHATCLAPHGALLRKPKIRR